MSEDEKTVPATPNEEEVLKELHTIGEAQDAVVLPGPSFQKKMRFSEGGLEYKTFLTRKFVERKSWQAPDPYKVLSHIPGSVIEIFVKAGAKVKKGEKLMIYEAMKMMNVVHAPMDGVIKDVNAKVGDHLPMGALLFSIRKGNK